MVTKIKPCENLTGEKFYQRKFPNLRYFAIFLQERKLTLLNVFINYNRSAKRDILMIIVVLPESVLAWTLSLSRSALSFSRGKGEGSLLSSSKKFLFPAAVTKKRALIHQILMLA